MVNQDDDLEQDEAEAPAEESMEALLAQQASVTEKLAGHKVTWVKVIQVTKDQVLVDVGEKKEGVVALSEFTGEAAKAAPAVGQRVPVILAGKRQDGAVVLSHRRARVELGWEAIIKAHKEKARVRGIVKSAIKGGFLVDVGGVTGFLPASLADLRPVRNAAKMVNTGVRCYIIELNEAKKQAVLSRKAVLEEEVGKRRDKLIDELKPGEVRIGRIVNASPTGIVVDIGGAEGFVRPADVAWGAAQASYQRGDKLRVKVLSKPAPAEPGKPEQPLYLGIKQLMPNPADAIRKKYPPKTVVRGKISEAGPAGVKFVLDDKRVAFSPAAECDPEAAYRAGDPVSAIVTGVSPSTFELVVSINKFEEVRDRKRLAQYLKAPPPLTLGQVLSPDKRD